MTVFPRDAYAAGNQAKSVRDGLKDRDRDTLRTARERQLKDAKEPAFGSD